MPAATGPPVTADELVRNADAAMYICKRHGDGGYRVFEKAMHERVVERLNLRAELQLALEERQLELDFQPLVDLQTGEAGAIEALCRWNHPTRGLVQPGQFIPLTRQGYFIGRPMDLVSIEACCASGTRSPPCRAASPHRREVVLYPGERPGTSSSISRRGHVKTHEDVKRRAQEDGIDFFLAQFVDMNGKPSAKLMPMQAVEELLGEGAGFAGFAAGPIGQTPASPDMLAVPDVSSYTNVPWQDGLARFACDITVEGKPWGYCPRTILRNAVERAAALGYRMKIGLEAAFFLVRKDERGRLIVDDPLDTADQPCYDAKALYRNYEFLTTLSRYINGLGWGNYANDHEDANGQFESNFDYDDVLVTCDRGIFFRYMVHVMAQQRGKLATFMPKPFSDLTGNGCHFHISLWDPAGEVNLFDDPADPRGFGLSGLAYAFIGGVLEHASGASAIVAPTVNSYKRIGVGAPTSGATWSPAYAAWGGNNRTQMIRVPGGPRFEHRSIDGSANPYLAAVAVLGSGLDGIERKLDPGPGNTRNLYATSLEEVARQGIGALPANLLEACAHLREDGVLRDWFGNTGSEDYVDYFAKTKVDEFNAYHSEVSQWEVDRYLTAF